MLRNLSTALLLSVCAAAPAFAAPAVLDNPALFTTPQMIEGLGVADLDNDTKLDFVTLEVISPSGTARICGHRGNGDTTFAAPLCSATPGDSYSYPRRLLIAPSPRTSPSSTRPVPDA